MGLMTGLQTVQVIVPLSHFAENLNNLYKFHSNKYETELVARAIAAVNVYCVLHVRYCTKHFTYFYPREGN